MLTEKFWEKYFKEYDNLNLLYPYKELLHEFVSNIEKIDKTNKLRLIDLGSGTGNLIYLINSKIKNIEIVGLDFSNVGLKMTESKIPNSKLILHNLNNKIPFEDDSFDIVVSNNTLYTIDPSNRPEVFKEIYRILKPEGHFMVSNIKQGFKPIRIYLSHIKEATQKDGLLKTFFLTIKLIKPTIKIFYYNYLVKREDSSGTYYFFKPNEQRILMIEAGFTNVTEDKIVYGGQAIFNKGTKSGHGI